MERLTESYEEYISHFPEELRGSRKSYPMDSGIIVEKLGAYEDLEEQGKLIILPCEIGSRVYMIYRFPGEGAWEIEEHTIKLEDLENIGKTVFLTRKEAEEEIRRKENNQ